MKTIIPYLFIAIAGLFPASAGAKTVKVVNAPDLVCKICGCIDPSLHKQEVADAARLELKVEPSFEEEGMWLDSVDGFALRYSEMEPNLSVLVSFDGEGNVLNYTYFFTFPYEDATRGQANLNQAYFVGNMLQELYDLKALIGANETSAIEMFDIDGLYGGHAMNLRLLDDPYTVNPPMAGQFILLFEVANGAPGGDTAEVVPQASTSY